MADQNIKPISLFKLFSFLKAHSRLIFLLLLTSMTAALLEGVGIALVFPVLQGTSQIANAHYPFPLGNLFEMFSGMMMAERLKWVAIFIVIITIVRNGILYIAELLNTRVQLVVIGHFRAKCMDQLMKMGMNYFNKQRTSDLQIVVDGYTESVTGAIVGLIGTAVPQFFTMLVLLGFLLVLSWPMTLAALVLVAVVSVVLHRVNRNILVASKILYEARMKFNRNLMDILHGMKLIRLFGHEDRASVHFEGHIQAFNRGRFDADKLIKMVAPVFETTGIGMLAVILFIGSFFVAEKGSEWIGVLLTFVVILTRIIGPVKTLNHVRATIIEKIPILEEITKLLATDDKEYVKNGSLSFDGLKRSIEVKDISFRYNPTSPVVLSHVSFSAQRGQKIGIVGPSGSGKSTLIELLLRFYDPQEGVILIDGVNLKEFELKKLRRFIGVVSQDIFLFHDTVKANIAFAKPDATQEEIEAAARKAYAHEFILSLPQGYDTRIGERGVLLSGGQRQRLAIARAVLIDPAILIFDEATSALDTESEKFVQNAIDAVGKGKTVITIAHRLSTVFNSDRIIVLERGQVIEQGLHEELLAKNGLYAKLVKMQELEREINEEEEKLKIAN